MVRRCRYHFIDNFEASTSVLFLFYENNILFFVLTFFEISLTFSMLFAQSHSIYISCSLSLNYKRSSNRHLLIWLLFLLSDMQTRSRSMRANVIRSLVRLTVRLPFATIVRNRQLIVCFLPFVWFIENSVLLAFFAYESLAWYCENIVRQDLALSNYLWYVFTLYPPP